MVMRYVQLGVDKLLALRRAAHERYHSMNTAAKFVFWLYMALHAAMMAGFYYVGPEKAFEIMADWGKSLQEMEYGPAVLIGVTILTSFPPLMGYGTCITLCGFSFGVWKGWVIGMAGCVLGGVISFVVMRRLIGIFAPLLGQDKTFRALGTAVRVKGLPLVILIRLCPFPFPYSNAFFASIESVTLFQFFIATLTITPKLFLHVWTGSRMFLLADPETRNNMDTRGKIINGVYVTVGTLLGMWTSWYLYKLTMQYVGEVQLGEGEDDIEAGLINDVDAMLDEEEEEEAERAAAAAVSRPKVATGGTPLQVPYRDEPRASNESLVRSGRPSEDWGGAFSDFDEPVEEREDPDDGLEEDGTDPLGWGLDTIPERPELSHSTSSSSTAKMRKD
ncbi:hypothetical protein T439DRAFT_324866 [Meredithblackwellia eburnea MCA 4105]